ncbi:MAG TPA: hypothetical protein VK571_09865 [Gemmatimonadaceae bacterium]|nr:hypothetical protein [Gemmatimonadaceae bacterium]HMG58026.1 hypothetical protein [Kofleriaceae bacterium]
MTRKTPDAARAAIDKYVEFHRYEPKKVGAFPASFRIPAQMQIAGRAKWVTYSSNKTDPETLKKPRNAISYIHEHDVGVNTYLPCSPSDDGAVVDVPARFIDVEALTRLGVCLGFCFEDASGDKCEAEGSMPMPDLYTTPDGKCLLVIQSRSKVLAMMWGGGLGVFARGIDG